MAGQVHHVAVNSDHFPDTVHFFSEVFQMEISCTTGEAPNRKFWFRQGIQVNEVPQVPQNHSQYDHIGIAVKDRAATLQKAAAFGCKPLAGKPNWFTTPDNIVIELMEA